MTNEHLLDDLADGFESQWRNGTRPDVAEYLDRVPVVQRYALAKLVIPIDVEYRVGAGEEPSAAEYDFADGDYRAIADSCLRASVAAESMAESRSMQDSNTVPPTVGRRMGLGLPDSADSELGNYQLIEPLGEGGMGTVWSAMQLRPVRRQVALKLIRPGMDSRSVLARFDAERQLLAMMDHPHIARVLDAGMTDDGRPYFAMELVLGTRLTAYCDERRLGIRERLTLVRQVCEAVQHAHQKGIIHRDLKPSNILVTEVDGKPVPKVIDFGLAKAVGGWEPITDQSLHTIDGAVLGTPLYMAPEQIQGNNLDVDTRTDVYALGAILYELLTGTTPLDGARAKGATWQQIREWICESDPPVPSDRLAAEGASGSPQSLDSFSRVRLVRGELDWIVMRALENERDRRYESPSALAADIDRYLNDEPVLAGPPSKAYRLRKFVKRNRGLVTTLSVIFLLLLAGISTTTWFAVRANEARVAAEEAAQLAQHNEVRAINHRREALDAIDEFFITISDVELLDSPGLQPLRLQLLDKAAEYYDTLLAAESGGDLVLLRADAKARYASMLGKLGQSEKSRQLLHEAMQDVESVRLPQPTSLDQFEIEVQILVGLAGALIENQDLGPAEEVLQSALGRVEQVTLPFAPGQAERLKALILHDLARLESARGQPKAVHAYLEQVTEVLEPLLQDDPEGKLVGYYTSALEGLASVSTHEESIEYLQRALDQRRELYERFPEKLSVAFDFASTLSGFAWLCRRHDPDRALASFQEAEGYLQQLHQQNPSVASYRNELARTLDLHAFSLHQSVLSDRDTQLQIQGLRDSLDLYDQSESVLVPATFQRDSEESIDALGKSQKALMAMIYNGRALVYRDLRDLDASLQQFQAAIRIQESIAEDAPDILKFQQDIAGTWYNMGKTSAAFQRYELAIEYLQKALEYQVLQLRKFPDSAGLRENLGNCKLELNRVLLHSGDYEQLEGGFQPASSDWEGLVRERGEFAIRKKQDAGLQEIFYAAAMGDPEPLVQALPEILGGSDEDADPIVDIAAMLSGTLEVVRSQDPEDANGVVDRLLEMAGQVVARMDAIGERLVVYDEVAPLIERLRAQVVESR